MGCFVDAYPDFTVPRVKRYAYLKTCAVSCSVPSGLELRKLAPFLFYSWSNFLSTPAGDGFENSELLLTYTHLWLMQKHEYALPPLLE